MNTNTPKITYVKDYTPPPFLVSDATLHFTLDPKETVVAAKLYIKRNPKNAHQHTLVLDGINMQLQSVKLDGKTLIEKNYKVTAETLEIYDAPDDFILETIVKICPEKNLTCSGLYLTGGNFCTQNEPNGFRYITYFTDRPDILTRFTTTIVADKTSYPILLSNGNLIEKKDLAGNLHTTTWNDPHPKSVYLLALIAGKFGVIEDHHITSKSKRNITLRIYAEEKHLGQCKHAMYALKQAMEWDEKEFGLEYDLDIYNIVAINDLNVGAMENKGLNVFNSNLVFASIDTATDDNFNQIAAVVAHEYFHNWTGNRVTCRDWFQIGLKEGLTTLREQLFMEDTYGAVINRIDSIDLIQTRQFAEDSGPLAHPVRLKSYIEVDNFYTLTVYEKSAEISRMLITIFGRDSFRKIMQNFLAKFDGTAVTFDDFLQVAAITTNTSLDQFKIWYDQAGTPTLNISDSFQHNSYNLTVRQELNPTQKELYIPLNIELIEKNSDTIISKMLPITTREQTFSFTNFSEKPVPSLLCGFSAPVKIKYEYTSDELLFLIARDKDPINRWKASERLLTNIVLKLRSDFVAKNDLALPEILVTAFKSIFDDKNTDPALIAELLRFPSEKLLLEAMPYYDVEAAFHVSEFLKLELAKKLKSSFLDIYNANLENKPYSLDSISIGKRSLKNLCLHYLMYLNTDDVYSIGKTQLENASNMTDRQTALVALVNSKFPERDALLENHFKLWQDDQNLLDKWFAINACIKAPGALGRIQKLMTHPAFNIKNPNKVYALIRTFAENNNINFHEPSGACYKFLADQVLFIDKFNPQLAAKIISPLTRCYKFEPARQELMLRELRRINNESNLSKNVFEITTKTLETKQAE